MLFEWIAASLYPSLPDITPDKKVQLEQFATGTKDV